MGREVANNNVMPKPVCVAHEALEAFENDSFYKELKKALVALAVQMDKSGTEPTAKVLRGHAQKGVEHVNSIKKTFSTKAKKPRKSYTEIVEELNKDTEFEEQESVNIEERDLSKFTLFEKAAHNGDIKTVKRLIKSADIEQKNWALRFSADNGHTEIVEVLLKARANNSKALVYSAVGGHIEIVKLLLGAGADAKVNNGSTLRLSLQNDHIEIVKLLLDAGAYTKSNDYFFVSSAENGHAEVVKLLLDIGVYAECWGGSAIRLSAENGHAEVVQVLLDHGESLDDVELTDKQRKNIETRLENLKLWREMYPSDPPKGLDGENPHGFKPKLFEVVKSWLIEEGHEEKDANKYAYGASTLFKNEEQILQYLEKWGQAGKQPLHNLTYMVKLSTAGKMDFKAWGDAVLKFGPEMAKLVKFADKLKQPAESLNKTREKCAEFAYERGGEHKELASLCMSHNVDEDDFEQALKIVLKNPKPKSNIPDIKISGNRFGMEGYSFSKLPDGDIRGLFLGEMTGCCQSIGGAGSDCAEKGYKSEDSGFYVVSDAKGKIIGQAWAWLGQNNELVFDSLESLTDRITTKQWEDICVEALKEIEKIKDNVTLLNVGTGGETPAMQFNRASSPAFPKTPNNYSDAEKQYRVLKRITM